ncbi:MAG TPA: FAD-dependent oxidoreductase [Blastocatellia bacterium]|nr:FAD-dependent oxidoreductase [Blastocatellia bacterium]
MTNELQTEILIVGGGVGGCAAALAAAQAGRQVILSEESDWLGGQFTSQAVPPDEHGWIEQFGCTAAYRSFRSGVRAYYQQHYPLTDEARNNSYLNPGNGWVSPLCHEPRVALAVLEAMLAPFVSNGRIRVLTEHCPVKADIAGDAVRSVTLLDLRTGQERTITARYFLDATELGELLPVTGTEFVTGAESQTDTGEPSAPQKAAPHNAQAFSVCFAMEHRAGEDHTIERPRDYSFWRDYVPQLQPAWPGRLLSWEITHPRTMQPHRYHFDPHREPSKAFAGLWTYRRILDRTNFTSGFYESDVTLMNVPMLDYLLGDLTNATQEERARHIEQARQLSYSFFYWLQTEAPRPDGGTGWPGLRLRGDLTGTTDGLAKTPYIRESRRIQAVFTIREQDVAEALRPGQTHAAAYADSVGIGYYRIDLHPSTGGDNYIDVGSLPFQIPLGALIPQRMENLLPASKNIGTTHITNGCYRLHPVEWNIGEAAGALAAHCLAAQLRPRHVYQVSTRLAEFQRELMQRGVELAWPAALRLAEGDPHAHAQR